MKLSGIISFLGAVAVSAAPLAKRASGFRFGGVNLAGCDFGMNVWGGSGITWCPSTSQISHFTNQGANLIRLPVGWQYLVGNNVASTSFDDAYIQKYDALVQGVLNTGAYALIDIHNYGRWNSGVVGSEISGQYFANIWSLLAAKYKNNPKVIFGLMNEPHDISGSQWTNWVAACQLAVNAIRAAGATSQMILLPGNFWTHPETWTSGENNAMLSITDPAKSDKSLLVLDAHKYFDSDGSGSSTTCTTNNLGVFQAFVNFLRSNGRQAILSEFGGGNNDGCATFISQAMSYLSANADAVIGFTAWSAGAFDSSYELNLAPNSDGSDQYLWTNAIKPYLPSINGETTSTSSTTPSTTSAAVSSTSNPAVTSSAVVTSSTVKSSAVASSTSSVVPTTSAATCTPVGKWGQCGGNGYSGCKVCVTGSTCQYNNDWYSQCL